MNWQDLQIIIVQSLKDVPFRPYVCIYDGCIPVDDIYGQKKKESPKTMTKINERVKE